MALFEFTVQGPPVSQQARRRERVRDWQKSVRRAAATRWPKGRQPLQENLRISIVYFCDDLPLDVDNIPKPIHDALSGLVFEDDSQIVQAVQGRFSLDEIPPTKDLPPVVSTALSLGGPFLYVGIQKPQELTDFLQ